MSENFTNIERLVRYLDNEMSEEERNSLESELAENSELQTELNVVRASQKAVRHYGITTNVSKLHKEMMEELKQPSTHKAVKSYVVRMLSSPLKIAAAVVVIIFAAVIFEYVSLSSQSVFSSQYIPFEVPNLRGDTVERTSIDYYRQKKYDLYINEFKKIVNPSADEEFMAGTSYLELGQPQKAIEALQRLQSADQSVFQQQEADYYLALAYLRNNDPSRAYTIFKKIRNDENHSYYNKVSRWLLIKLKMLSFKQ